MNSIMPVTLPPADPSSHLAETRSAWVLLRSGRRLDLLAPTPNAWTDEDLALGLARVSRWAGQSRWDRPLSVAQHSLLVLALREQDERGRLPPNHALRELLHDADEAWLGEVLWPIKPCLGDGYAALVSKMQRRLPPATGCRRGRRQPMLRTSGQITSPQRVRPST